VGRAAHLPFALHVVAIPDVPPVGGKLEAAVDVDGEPRGRREGQEAGAGHGDCTTVAAGQWRGIDRGEANSCTTKGEKSILLTSIISRQKWIKQ